MKYHLNKDPYDCEILFPENLERELSPGITVLTGCNGSGKSTILHAIKEQYSQADNCKVFSWDGRYDKGYQKDFALESQQYDLLASLSFSSEGEEINTNLGILVQKIGSFLRKNQDKDIIILLDGIDSGLSVDNIIEMKEFFRNFIIPDVKSMGHECYIVMPANEYELARGEQCVDARSGEEVSFRDYEAYRKYILDSRIEKDHREQTRRKGKNS